jgi:hypothetical protein
MTQGHAQPSHQFAHTKGLGQVVISPGIQGGDFIVFMFDSTEKSGDFTAKNAESAKFLRF